MSRNMRTDQDEASDLHLALAEAHWLRAVGRCFLVGAGVCLAMLILSWFALGTDEQALLPGWFSNLALVGTVYGAVFGPWLVLWSNARLKVIATRLETRTSTETWKNTK